MSSESDSSLCIPLDFAGEPRHGHKDIEDIRYNVYPLYYFFV